MKRAAAIAVVLTWVIMLVSCGKPQEITGYLTEPQFGSDGKIISFVLQEKNEQRAGVKLSGDTTIAPWPGVPSLNAPGQSGEKFNGAVVTVTGKHGGKNYKAANGQMLEVINAATLRVESVKEGPAGTLKDGRNVTAWLTANGRAYRTDDGTTLLEENNSPLNVTTLDATDQAKKAIGAYYEKQGKLYDVKALLEQAGTSDQPIHIEQTVAPTAQSKLYLFIRTSVVQPVDKKENSVAISGAVFDRETGASVSPFELFSVPREEAVKTLLDAGKVTDQAKRAEIEKLLGDQNILFFKDHLELTFAPGALKGEKLSYTISVPLNDQVKGIIKPDAMPSVVVNTAK